jgi:hypothetical protein
MRLLSQLLCHPLAAELIFKTTDVKAICRGPTKLYGIRGHGPLGFIGE